MVLSDSEILDLIASNGLINPPTKDSAQNCRYDLSAGRAFSPETGEELVPGKDTEQGRSPSFWTIKPSETLMIMTKEVVSMPSNLMASYTALNGLARKGLLLINASIVEPGYTGYLSCLLVNFSKVDVRISPGDAVAKMCFYEISGNIINPYDGKSTGDYAVGLGKVAANFPKSFLGIGDIESRLEDVVTRTAKRSFIFAGLGIGFLLLWATLEPVSSKWIYDRTGLSTNTSILNQTKLQDEFRIAAEQMKAAKNDIGNLEQLRAIRDDNEQLKAQVEKLRADVVRLSSKVGG